MGQSWIPRTLIIASGRAPRYRHTLARPTPGRGNFRELRALPGVFSVLRQGERPRRIAIDTFGRGGPVLGSSTILPASRAILGH